MLPNHTVAPVNFAVGSKAAVVTVTIVATIEKKAKSLRHFPATLLEQIEKARRKPAKEKLSFLQHTMRDEGADAYCAPKAGEIETHSRSSFLLVEAVLAINRPRCITARVGTTTRELRCWQLVQQVANQLDCREHVALTPASPRVYSRRNALRKRAT